MCHAGTCELFAADSPTKATRRDLCNHPGELVSGTDGDEQQPGDIRRAAALGCHGYIESCEVNV